MKNRYLLCILLAVALVYFAVPRLSPITSGIEGIFSISWLVLAIVVIAGNLSALLFLPKKQVQKHVHSQTPRLKRLRARP